MMTSYAVATYMAADHRRELERAATDWQFTREARGERRGRNARPTLIHRVRATLHRDRRCLEPAVT